MFIRLHPKSRNNLYKKAKKKNIWISGRVLSLSLSFVRGYLTWGSKTVGKLMASHYNFQGLGGYINAVGSFCSCSMSQCGGSIAWQCYF